MMEMEGPERDKDDQKKKEPDSDTLDDMDGVDWVDLSRPEEWYNYAGEDYPGNWPEISWRYRESCSWTCEQCDVNLSNQKNLLHVHHIDGRRYNNHSGNLMAVCFLCHADQPGHEMLQREIPAGARMTIMREREKLVE